MVEQYNRTMAERMGWAKTRQGLNPYEYHPERGADGVIEMCMSSFMAFLQ